MSATAASVPAAVATGRFAILRRLFSFPAMLASLLTALAVLTVRDRFNDPDMWWHLKTGEVIWTTHSIPTTDLFSYTTGHHAWVPHEWLSQLTIYGAYAAGGYTGLMLWLAGTSALLLILGYLLCSLYSGNAKVAFAGALLIWLFSTVGLAVRPQMIGYALLTLELIFLHLGRTRNPRWFYLLPPLFALWVDCHGTFFFGLALSMVYLLSAWFPFAAGGLTAERWDGRTRKILTIVLALSGAAVFLNPHGYKAVFYPIQTMVSLPQAMQATSEWQPLVLHSVRGVALLATLAVMVLLVIAQRAVLLWHELLLLALVTWLTLGHSRLVFAFGIVAAPVLCRMLGDSWEGYDAAHDRILPNVIFMALAALAVVIALPSPQNLQAQVEKQNPVKALAFLRKHHISGPMLNEFVYGGYLLWAAPEYPVFIDGRGDIYEWTGVFAEFGNWAMLQSDPRELLAKHHIGFCLLAKDAPMAHVLPLMGWRAVYQDDLAVVFTHPLPAAP